MSYISSFDFDEREDLLNGSGVQSSVAINIKKVKHKKFSELQTLPFYPINDFIKSDDGEEEYTFSASETNHIAYRYHKVNDFYPNMYRFETFFINKFINELFKKFPVPTTCYTKVSYQSTDENKITFFAIAFKKDLVLLFEDDDSGVLFYNPEDEKDINSLFYTILSLLKYVKKPKVAKNKIYIVYRTAHGFDKMGFKINKTHVNLNDNYNDGFIDISEKIIEGLNDKNKTNLVILSGEPGVGKTTYVRYLTSKLKKNIIFISPDMVDSITDPAFIPFLMKNDDSILIIEDAEPALEKRNQGGRSSAVSNVLNLTDGLLSDCLKISIVATFNTGTKTLDEALLRRGRLLMNYKFEKLDIEKSKKLLEKIGHKEIEVKEPMTLADIYYYGTDNNAGKAQSKKIGF